MRLVASGAVAVAIAAAAYAAAERWRPSPGQYPLQGVDLGERPGEVAWPSVRAAGADFAYVVATAGTDRRDPDFETNWAALPDAGLRRGAVHLFSLCADGGAQADGFNATVPADADALPPAVDLDRRDGCDPAPGPAVTDNLRRFAARVEAHMGKALVLRVSRSAERRYGFSQALIRPLWLESSFVRPGYGARPWRLWRASSWRRLDGVEGTVNWDVVAP